MSSLVVIKCRVHAAPTVSGKWDGVVVTTGRQGRVPVSNTGASPATAVFVGCPAPSPAAGGVSSRSTTGSPHKASVQVCRRPWAPATSWAASCVIKGIAWLSSSSALRTWYGVASQGVALVALSLFFYLCFALGQGERAIPFFVALLCSALGQEEQAVPTPRCRLFLSFARAVMQGLPPTSRACRAPDSCGGQEVLCTPRHLGVHI